MHANLCDHQDLFYTEFNTAIAYILTNPKILLYAISCVGGNLQPGGRMHPPNLSLG
jgi:hypothetical protein